MTKAEPGEEPITGVPAGGAHGHPTRAEMAARYPARTGRDLSALPCYEGLALFKLALILEGGYAGRRAAGVADRDKTMAELLPRLLRGAAAFARGERR